MKRFRQNSRYYLAIRQARGITIILADSNFKTIFFNPEGNGNPIIFQHIF